MNFLTIAACVKDERDLPEWVAWHLMIGVERFLIYDNESSSVLPADTLRTFIEAGIVTVFPYLGRAAQFPIYQDAITKGKEAKWAAAWFAMIDADEFILPMGDADGLVRHLESMEEKQAGLALHWRMFGSSGHVERPKGLVIENYLRCADHTNRHTKCIIRPNATAGCYNAHFFPYGPGYYCVDELGRPVGGPFGNETNPTEQILRINHYCVKSQEDQALRIARGSVDIYPEGGRNARALAEHEPISNTAFSMAAACRAPGVRRILAQFGYPSEA